MRFIFSLFFFIGRIGEKPSVEETLLTMKPKTTALKCFINDENKISALNRRSLK